MLEEINKRLNEEISERTWTERALRESEERYRSVYNTAPLAFVVWDRECRVTDWNNRAEKLFGWSRQEILNHNFFEFLVPEKARPHVEDVVHVLLREELPNHSINENLTKTGKIILCEWNNSILRGSDGHIIGAISLALDITERKHLQEQLLQSEKMSALGQMISGIAHELNNPLTGVLGYTQLILMSSDLPEKIASPLQTINHEAERAREIIQKPAHLRSPTHAGEETGPHQRYPQSGPGPQGLRNASEQYRCGSKVCPKSSPSLRRRTSASTGLHEHYYKC